MIAGPTRTIGQAPPVPVDPQSAAGKRIATDLGRVFSEIDERVAREAARKDVTRKRRPA